MSQPSANTGIIEIAPSNGSLFTGALSNDFIICNQVPANIWLGSGSNAPNYLQVGTSTTTTSNMTVTGTTTLSNLTVSGTVTGFNGVSSNQSFSNVYSSNIYSSNVEVNGPMKVTGVLTVTGGITGTVTNATNAVNAVTATNSTNASNLVGTPNITVGTVVATSITSTGTHTNTGAFSNIGTFSNSGTVYASMFNGPLTGNATSATTTTTCTGNAYSASNLVGTPNITVGSVTSTGTHTNTGAFSNIGTFSNSGTVYASLFNGPLTGNATSATTTVTCSGNAYSASNLVGTPNITIQSATASNFYGSNATISTGLRVNCPMYLTSSTSTYINNIQTPQVFCVGNGSITAGAGYVVYSTKILDTSSSYNQSTGLFTAPITGLYNISASFYNSTNTNCTTVDITKNSAQIYYRQFVGYLNNAIDATISGAMFLNVGETIGINTSYMNNQNIQVDQNHALSIFLIH